MTEPAANSSRSRTRSLRNLPPVKPPPAPAAASGGGSRLGGASFVLALLALVAALAALGLTLLGNPLDSSDGAAEGAVFSDAQATIVAELVAEAVSAETERLEALALAAEPTDDADEMDAMQATPTPGPTDVPVVALGLDTEGDTLYRANLSPLLLSAEIPDDLNGALELVADGGATFLTDLDADCRSADEGRITLDDPEATVGLCAHALLRNANAVTITASLFGSDGSLLGEGFIARTVVSEPLLLDFAQLQSIGDETLACPLFELPDADSAQVPFQFSLTSELETEQFYATTLSLPEEALGQIWLGTLNEETEECVGAPIGAEGFVLQNNVTYYGTLALPPEAQGVALPPLALALDNEAEFALPETPLLLNPIVTTALGQAQLFEAPNFISSAPALPLTPGDLLVATARDAATGAVRGEVLVDETPVTVWVPLGPDQRPTQFRTLGDVSLLPTAN